MSNKQNIINENNKAISTFLANSFPPDARALENFHRSSLNIEVGQLHSLIDP